MYCDSSRFDRFVANRSLQSRIVSPEVDSQNAGTGGVNWLRFESIRSIRRESVLAKSNRFTGSRFAVCRYWGYYICCESSRFARIAVIVGKRS